MGRRIALVDPRVRDALERLAARYAACGVRLFLFGSAASSWPCAPVDADFDLGCELPAAAADREALWRELRREVEALPTVRPIDLVDFSSVSDAFRREALQCAVDLAHERPRPTTC